MKQAYKFVVLKNKFKTEFNSTVPDFDNIIEINGNLFTIAGWNDEKTGNISFTMQEITQDRLDGNTFLVKKVNDYKKWQKEQAEKQKSK